MVGGHCWYYMQSRGADDPADCPGKVGQVDKPEAHQKAECAMAQALTHPPSARGPHCACPPAGNTLLKPLGIAQSDRVGPIIIRPADKVTWG